MKNDSAMPLKNVNTGEIKFITSSQIIGGFERDGQQIFVTIEGEYKIIDDPYEVLGVAEQIEGFVKANEETVVNIKLVEKIDEVKRTITYPNGKSVKISEKYLENVMSEYEKTKNL